MPKITTKNELVIALNYLIQIIQQAMAHATEQSKQEQDRGDFQYFDGKAQGLSTALSMLRDLKAQIEE